MEKDDYVPWEDPGESQKTLIQLRPIHGIPSNRKEIPLTTWLLTLYQGDQAKKVLDIPDQRKGVCPPPGPKKMRKM